MACTYCYAGGGHYYAPESLMEPELAVRVFDHFTSHFGEIRQVLYFGGEPLVGLPILQRLCEHLRALVERHALAKLPKLATVTNGTLIAGRPAFLSLAREFGFSVTVSIDGPKELNDRTRVMRDGAGSFDRIRKGLSALRREGIPFSVECTYTRSHLSAGWLPEDLYTYFVSLGAEHVIIVEEMSCSKSADADCDDFSQTMLPHWIRLFARALEEWKEQGVMKLAGPEQVFGAMVLKPPLLAKRFCEGGLESFAVNPEGIVYPCHILNNNREFSLGYYEEVTMPADPLPRKDNVRDCASCPIKRYCRTCPARMYVHGGGNGFRPIPAQCDLNKASFILARKALADEGIPQDRQPSSPGSA